MHAGYFGVSVIHRTLTGTPGSSTCACDLFACVYTSHGGPRFIVSSEGLLVVCTEFDSGEISRLAQNLAHNGHPSDELGLPHLTAVNCLTDRFYVALRPDITALADWA